MTCRYDGEGRILELRLAPLGHGGGEVRIVPSPDQLDWNIQRLERGQMLGVSGVFIEEFRRQLHEGRTGAGSGDEVVADQRTDERAEMGYLRLRQGVQEFLLLPFQQPAKLFGALGDRYCKGLHAPSRKERD